MPLHPLFAALQPLALSLGASQLVGHLAQRHASMVRHVPQQHGRGAGNRPFPSLHLPYVVGPAIRAQSNRFGHLGHGQTEGFAYRL